MSIRSEIIMSSYSVNKSLPYSRPEFVNGIANDVPIVDTTGVDTLMPINPVTGWRDGDLKRLFDPTVPTSEKELIMSTLNELKANNSPKGLTDDDLMMMIPSRYISDPVEVEHYMQSLKEYRDSILAEKEQDNQDTDDTDASTDPGSAPAATPSVE